VAAGPQEPAAKFLENPLNRLIIYTFICLNRFLTSLKERTSLLRLPVFSCVVRFYTPTLQTEISASTMVSLSLMRYFEINIVPQQQPN
jgi:hypothetical protein